jgi:hypothetical protein
MRYIPQAIGMGEVRGVQLQGLIIAAQADWELEAVPGKTDTTKAAQAGLAAAAGIAPALIHPFTAAQADLAAEVEALIPKPGVEPQALGVAAGKTNLQDSQALQVLLVSR